MHERPILFSTPLVPKLLDGSKTQTRRIVDQARLRVRLPYEVRSDLPDYLPGAAELRAPPGGHPATIGRHGAVCAKVGGRELGLRPGEFDFVCPYAEGTTRLVTLPDGRKEWRIEPHESRLWVRETWGLRKPFDITDWHRGSVKEAPELPDGWEVDFAAEWGNSELCFWRPSIHMPRWACRILLEVLDVRLQHLQAITEEDVAAEGVCLETSEDPRYLDAYARGPRAAFAWLWDHINGARASWASDPWVFAVSFRRLEVPRV